MCQKMWWPRFVMLAFSVSYMSLIYTINSTLVRATVKPSAYSSSVGEGALKSVALLPFKQIK